MLGRELIVNVVVGVAQWFLLVMQCTALASGLVLRIQSHAIKAIWILLPVVVDCFPQPAF
jgi:hypothetical protein